MHAVRFVRRLSARWFAAFVASAAAGVVLAAQEPAPAPAPQDPPRPAPHTPLDAPADAAQLAPGALPADASPAARRTWEALCSALGAAADAPRVEAFDLSFDARAWAEGGEGEKSFRNARLRFLAPNFVDSALDSGRRRMRGPRGDWIVDAQGTAVRLQGVEMAQDRRELDQILQVARTFANLVNARTLRLRKLETVATPPFELPAALAQRASSVTWLSLVSPDFALARSDGGKSSSEVRAWIALDSATSLPSLAVVAEESTDPAAPHTALLIELWNWAPLDGLRSPKNVRTYPPLSDSPKWGFQDKQNLQLWLTKGSLRAKLAPIDFEPPRK